jgi:hypothetical protein
MPGQVEAPPSDRGARWKGLEPIVVPLAVVATRGILEHLVSEPIGPHAVLAAALGEDCGDVPQDDACEHARSVLNGDRVLYAYEIVRQRCCLITDVDPLSLFVIVAL